MKKYDVAAIGELLIDFTQNGLSAQGNGLFEANPGGGPANMAAMLARLGKKCVYITKVGADQFGATLKAALDEVGIDSQYVAEDPVIHTTLALVHTLEGGDRSFSFYRNPGADMMLVPEEVPDEIFPECRLLHFSSLTLTHEGVRAATHKAVRLAKENNMIVSFDPNLRPPLWDSLETAKEQILWGISVCDILKISDNEIQWLTGEDDFTEGVKWIRDRYDIPLILVSMGPDGSRAYYKSSENYVEKAPFLRDDTIETTGAGDTFCACVVNYVLEHGLDDLTPAQLDEMLTFANAAASIITTRKGALRVMPYKDEVEAFLNEYLVKITK